MVWSIVEWVIEMKGQVTPAKALAAEGSFLRQLHAGGVLVTNPKRLSAIMQHANR